MPQQQHSSSVEPAALATSYGQVIEYIQGQNNVAVLCFDPALTIAPRPSVSRLLHTYSQCTYAFSVPFQTIKVAFEKVVARRQWSYPRVKHHSQASPSLFLH